MISVNACRSFTIKIEPSIGDGSCYFHSILRAVDPVYIQLPMHQKSEYVYKFRCKLADLLPTVFMQLSRGTLHERYPLSHLQQELRSHQAVDDVFQEFVSDLLNIDIYIIDRSGNKRQLFDEILIKGRPSVLLIYNGFHYDVGYLEENGIKEFILDPGHCILKKFH